VILISFSLTSRLDPALAFNYARFLAETAGDGRVGAVGEAPIWPLCSTGSAVACCRGAYRSPWASLPTVESGKRADRPELEKALAACKKQKAKLVIAKLDRLSRNLAFIATLMESGVEFVAVDNPPCQ
jgi:hypothetical protein